MDRLKLTERRCVNRGRNGFTRKLEIRANLNHFLSRVIVILISLLKKKDANKF